MKRVNVNIDRFPVKTGQLSHHLQTSKKVRLIKCLQEILGLSDLTVLGNI